MKIDLARVRIILEPEIDFDSVHEGLKQSVWERYTDRFSEFNMDGSLNGYNTQLKNDLKKLNIILEEINEYFDYFWGDEAYKNWIEVIISFNNYNIDKAEKSSPLFGLDKVDKLLEKAKEIIHKYINPNSDPIEFKEEIKKLHKILGDYCYFSDHSIKWDNSIGDEKKINPIEGIKAEKKWMRDVKETFTKFERLHQLGEKL